MSLAPIDFLFDYVSPYSYVAWTQVHALARRHARAVQPVPVLFAGLLDAHGNTGPAEIPAKRLYIFKDVLRTATLLGLPFAPPPSHPFNPLLALRVSSLVMKEDSRVQLITALFAATWAGGGGVATAEQIRAILDGIGLDGADLIARAGADGAKALLRRQTDAAIARGVFGVPTLLVDGELFWGYDAFVHVDRFLSGQERLDPALIARWRSLPSSSDR